MNRMDIHERRAYVCPICHATWPHPSYKCSGIGGFADHPETATVLEKLIPAPARGVVDRSERRPEGVERYIRDALYELSRNAPDSARSYLRSALDELTTTQRGS